MGTHLDKDGKFQSDKYPECPAGKVPLSVKDPMAQDLLWEYARRRRPKDGEFSEDLETALRAAGYEPPGAARLLRVNGVLTFDSGGEELPEDFFESGDDDIADGDHTEQEPCTTPQVEDCTSPCTAEQKASIRRGLIKLLRILDGVAKE